MSEKYKIPKALWIMTVILALIVGGFVTYGAFPRIEIEKEIVIEKEYINITETITLIEELEVSVFDAYLWRLDAWNFALDENFYDLRYCGDENDRDKYKAYEIEWNFDDNFVYDIIDFDRNWYTVYFIVEGDYDNECDASYDIEVSYYKNREPNVEINLIE